MRPAAQLLTVTAIVGMTDESRAVAAVLAYAARRPHGEERVDPSLPYGVDDPEVDDLPGLFLAAEHGIDATRVSAYRGLGRSRGLGLDEVLRAAFRGELADVVRLPDLGQRRP